MDGLCLFLTVRMRDRQQPPRGLTNWNIATECPGTHLGVSQPTFISVGTTTVNADQRTEVYARYVEGATCWATSVVLTTKSFE